MKFPLGSACAIALAVASFGSFAYIGPEEIEVGVKDCAGQYLNTFRCARGIESKTLSAGRLSVKRSGNTLTIRTKRKRVRLVDNFSESGGELIAYSYLGYLRPIESHVVHVQYYEGGTYMVVNSRSGHSAYPSGFPAVSPDRRHFLSVSEDMFAGYDPNNVEVWRVTSTEYRRVANFEPSWGPRSASWLDSGQFEVNKVCHMPSEENAAELRLCGKARGVRSNAGWKLLE